MPRKNLTDLVRRHLWAGHRCDFLIAKKRWGIEQPAYQKIIETLRREFPIDSDVKVVVVKVKGGKTRRARIASHQRVRLPMPGRGDPVGMPGVGA